jgi:putative FmdB family regulatory protein
MPTYEYACKGCGEHLEVVQSFKDDALTECPACGGDLRKVFSAAGLIFKGSGWHSKDYATSSRSMSGSSSSGETKDSTSSDSTSSTSFAASGIVISGLPTMGLRIIT